MILIDSNEIGDDDDNVNDNDDDDDDNDDAGDDNDVKDDAADDDDADDDELNKPGRANRCVRSGSVCNHNVFCRFWAFFGGNRRTDGHTDGRTDRRTDPLIEMQGRI